MTQKTELHHSSPKSPCPVCEQEDGLCAWSDDQTTVLCATLRQDVDINAIDNEAPSTGTRGRGFSQRQKSHSQRTKDATKKAAEVEIKVDELVMMVASGYESKDTAQIALTAWCKEHGHDKFAATQLLRNKLKAIETSADEESPRLLREYQKIKRSFGAHLRFNELLGEVELDGQYLDPAMAKLELVVTHRQNLRGCREDVSDCVVKVARENSYSPVKEYLESVFEKHGADEELISNVAQHHLGSNDPIHQTQIKRFLIAAVARVYDPGCKHDCALIIQGPQGWGKSTFFKILASADWFDDSIGNSSDKDEKLKLHRSWIVEWAELETAFRRRDVSQIKAFMSSAVDILRPPFGRSIQTLKRSSVIVGSTNQMQFLADTTGNRRFWVVPMKQQLDKSKLTAERDRLWSAAVALYKAGEQWWLTDEENQKVDASRAQYESVDPWLYPIQEYIEDMPAVTTEAILTNALELQKSNHNSGHARRVADIMRQLGWEQTPNPVAHNGSRKRIWKFVGIQKSLRLA